MRLGQKCTCLQSPVLAFAHHALHVLVRELQVFQQHAFKLIRPLRILGHSSHSIQHQRRVSFANSFPKRFRPAKISLRQLFNLSHAELLSAESHHEVFNVLLLDPVHAHELPQGVHIGIDGKSPAEDLLAHGRTHLADQPQPHAHPSLAPR